MKRVFYFLLVFLLFLNLPAVSCRAGSDVADLDIWVEIENGGTAILTTEDGSPLPEQSRLVLEAEETLAFHIDFTRVGTYSYFIQIEPDEREIAYDTTVYHVTVYVTDEDGELIANVVIYRSGETGKYVPPVTRNETGCMVVFANLVEGGPGTGTDDEPAETPPGGTQQPSEGWSPTTGDASGAELYLACAILSAAGLFSLAAHRLIKARKEN